MIAQVEEQKTTCGCHCEEASSADFSRSAGEAIPRFYKKGEIASPLRSSQ